VCVPECPVNAIYSDADVPAGQQEFIEINRELSEVWSNITKKEPALPDADNWAKVLPKRQLLDRG
jgi:ferredoxin